MRWFGRPVIALSVVGFMISEADARIARIEITKTEPAFGGQSFGDAGPYEHLAGRVVANLIPPIPPTPAFRTSTSRHATRAAWSNT